MTTFKNTILFFMLGMVCPFMALHAQYIPDNIITASCFTDPPGQNWSIASSVTAENNLSNYQSVVTGDIDGDGIVEIICAANPTDGTVNIGGTNYYRSATHIAIYKGNNIHQAPTLFPTTKPFSWNYKMRYGIVKTTIGGKDSVLIVVAEGDRMLRAYNYEGKPVWTSSTVYHATLYDDVSPVFGDANHDGIPEIAIAGSLFNSVNGQLICSIPAGYPYSDNKSQTAQLVDIFDDGQVKYVIGDHIYDITLNAFSAITGMTLNRVVSLPADWNLGADPDYVSPLTTHNSINTLFVDMDGDEKLEMIVAHSYSNPTYTVLYIANPADGDILAAKYIPEADYSGYPLVGDVDGDGKPDISLIKGLYQSTVSGSYQILSYKYETGNRLLIENWSLPHTDVSCMTGLTLFDFDQDGKAELVYRDQTRMRIIDGTPDGAVKYPNRNKAIFINYSGTGAEYPVVADVDGDGQAEIIIVGGKTGADMYGGSLWVFKSGDPAGSPWAPARKVWNQQTYHPAYVNSDLSIPANPIYPATKFPGPDGILGTGDDVQPFNNFLQQQTMLNQNGTPLWLTPRAEYNTDPAYDYYPDGDSLRIHIDVINMGEASLQAPFYISVYKNSGLPGNIVKTDSLMQVVPINGTAQKVISIKNLANYLPFDSLIIQLNDKNLGKYVQLECDTTGNRKGEIRGKIMRAHPDFATVQKYYSVEINVLPNDSLPASVLTGISIKDSVLSQYQPKAGILNGVGHRIIYTNTGGPLTNNIDSFRYQVTFFNTELSAYRTYAAWVYIYVLDDKNGAAACSGQEYKVELSPKPAGLVTFNWYDSGGGGAPSVGNTRTETNTTDATFQIQPAVSIPRYTLWGGFPKGDFTIKLANPGGITPTMRWTGLADSLWQNPANWVELKSDASGKPYEAPASFAPTTCVNVIIPSTVDYFPELVDSAYCNDILMKDRAMLKNPHVLVYRNASVEIKLKPSERDRFVMWSAPLQNMYSGDYHYRVGDNPYWGDVFMNYFQQRNPDTQVSGLATINHFTATTGTVNERLDLGRAFNLKVATTTVTRDSLLRFPRTDPAYTYNGRTTTMPRAAESKFITHGKSGVFGMWVSGADLSGVSLVQVVNPYLAYLDFNKFAAPTANDLSGYYTWSGDPNDGFVTILSDTTRGNRIITSAPSYSLDPNWIPPLQSFFIPATWTITMSRQVQMSADWTTVRPPTPTYSLRASKKTVSSGGVLHITLSQGEKKAYAALLYNPSASNFTNDPEDMPAIIYDELPLAVYTISMNEALSINSSSTFDMFNVPIGFRATTAGETKLEFTNQETFGYEVVLIDKTLNKRIDLGATPEYTFTVTKTGSAPVEINDRFSLEMRYTGNGVTITGNESAPPPTTLQVSADAGYIYIKSESGVIGSLQVYDTVGKLIYSTANLNERQFTLPVNGKQMYIVKATIGEATVVEKIMSN